MSITHVFNIWTIPENYLNISTCNRESVIEWYDVTIYVGRDQIYHNYKSPSGVIGYDITPVFDHLIQLKEWFLIPYSLNISITVQC